MPKYIILTLLISFCDYLSAQILVSSENGTMVRLTPDGSWEEVELPEPDRGKVRSFIIPADATNIIEGYNKRFSIRYNEEKWYAYRSTEVLTDGRNAIVLQFAHRDGDAIGVVTADSVILSPKRVIYRSLQEIKQKSTEFNVAYGEVFNVNNHMIYMVIIQVTQKGIPITYFNYYYSDKAGSYELQTYCNQNAFDTFEDDFKDLLNGFETYLK